MVAITSVNPTSPKPGDATVVNLSGASNNSGKTLELAGVNLSLTGQNLTSISLTWPDLHLFGSTPFMRYSQAYALEVNDAGDVYTVNVTTAPKVGYTFGAISALTGIFADDVGVATSDELYGYFTVGSGSMSLAGIFTGTFPSTFRYWVYDLSAGQWVGPADAQFVGTNEGYPTTPYYAMNREPVRGMAIQGSAGHAQQANPVQAYTMRLEYDFLGSADVASIFADYDTYRTELRELTYRGDVYLVQFADKVGISEDGPLTRKVVVKLHAQKQ